MSIYNSQSKNNVHLRAGEITCEDLHLYDPVSDSYLRPLVRDDATPITLPSYIKEEHIQFSPTAIWNASSTQNILDIHQGLTWDAANSRILQTSPQYMADTAGNTTLAAPALINLQTATDFAYFKPTEISTRGSDLQEVAFKKDGIWIHNVIAGGGHDSTKPSMILDKAGISVRATNDASNVTLSLANLANLQRFAAASSATATTLALTQSAITLPSITSIADTSYKLLTMNPTTKRLFYQDFPASATVPSYIQASQIQMSSSTTGASNLLLSTADNSLLSSIVGSTVSSVKIASGAATFSQQGYADAVLDASAARNLVKIGAVIKPSTTNPDRAVQINSVTYPGDALSIGSGISIYDATNSINYTRLDKNGLILYNTGGTAAKTLNYDSASLANNFVWTMTSEDFNHAETGNYTRSSKLFSNPSALVNRIPLLSPLSSGNVLEIKFASPGLSSMTSGQYYCVPFFVNEADSTQQVVASVTTNFPEISASIETGVTVFYSQTATTKALLLIFRNNATGTVTEMQSLKFIVTFAKVGGTASPLTVT